MSIFRLFKSAVVLSIVLYFEGCGGGDKNSKEEEKSNKNTEVLKKEIGDAVARVIQFEFHGRNSEKTPETVDSIEAVQTIFNDLYQAIDSAKNDFSREELNQAIKTSTEKHTSKMQNETKVRMVRILIFIDQQDLNAVLRNIRDNVLENLVESLLGTAPRDVKDKLKQEVESKIKTKKPVTLKTVNDMLDGTEYAAYKNSANGKPVVV